MTRSVPEWIGKTDDTPCPPRVKLRIFERHNGICHISGRKIMPGEKWDVDHIKALINGGRNAESNMAPALKKAHKAKTKLDLAEKSKMYEIRAKHTGVVRPQGKIKSRAFRSPPSNVKQLREEL